MPPPVTATRTPASVWATKTPISEIMDRNVMKVDAKTGVEMEALTAVSIACLTIYDMVKAVDRAMSFSGIRLVEKTGGRSGHFKR